MLLAIVDLIAAGRTAGNRIPYSPVLLEVFRRYFDEVRSADDQPNAHLPYWHLRGDGFLHHAPADGQEAAYAAVSSVKGSGELARLVQYAYLDDDLFALLSDESGRRQFRDAIIDRYFPEHRDSLLAISEDEQEIGVYEQAIEERMNDSRRVLPQVREAVNDTAVAFYDAFPLSKGHALVVPRLPIISLSELDADIQAAVWDTVRRTRQYLEEQYAPDGFNIGVNDGEAAGQTVPHAHVHVIPRYKGDVPDPRGGIRWVIPERAAYWSKKELVQPRNMEGGGR